MIDIKINNTLGGDRGRSSRHRKQCIGILAQPSAGYGLYAGLETDGGIGGHIGYNSDARQVMRGISFFMRVKNVFQQVAKIILLRSIFYRPASSLYFYPK